MTELRKVLKKYGWKYLGQDEEDEGWDAPIPDSYVCSINSKGWNISYQWSGCPPELFSEGKTAEELETSLSTIASFSSHMKKA